MPPQFVREEFETPANIAISVERADAAVLAIDQGLAFVNETWHIVVTGTQKG